jgi:hypothetical protein
MAELEELKAPAKDTVHLWTLKDIIYYKNKGKWHKGIRYIQFNFFFPLE